MSRAFTAVFPLTDAPLADADISALGGNAGVTAQREAEGQVWIDPIGDDVPWARRDDQQGCAISIGWVDDLPARGQEDACLRRLSSAMDDLGDAACRTVPGEWIWMHWDAQSRHLTLAASENRLRQLYYASNGVTAVVSTSLRRIAQLAWVSGDFDTNGLLLSVSRTQLRESLGDRTVLDGVHSLPPGHVVTLGAGHARRSNVAPPRAVLPKWTGSFDDAVAQSKGLLQEIVDTHLARHQRFAVYLSGGLDSSTTAWLVASRSGDPSSHFAISSAAPRGSGLADETPYAEEVANAIGMPFHRVVPDETASPYRPSAQTFAAFESPAISQRHYLYDALNDAAAAQGATCVVDGVFGEQSVTTKIARPWYVAPMRSAKRAVASALRRVPSEGPQDYFHARIAKHRLHDVVYPNAKTPISTKVIGWRNAELALAVTQTSNLWAAFPFRDKRLLELVETMPPEFHLSQKHNRRLVRAILKGQVPDSIRLRPSGMPFSPDYEMRLQTFVLAARDRIPVFRSAGVDDWLDLNWLHGSLTRAAEGKARPPQERLQAQVTAITAEFIVWWSNADRLG